MKTTRYFILSALFLVVFPLLQACVSAPGNDPNERLVRIAILNEVPEVNLDIRGIYQIEDPVNKRVLADGRQLKSIRIIPVKNGIEIGGELFSLNEIKFLTNKDIGVDLGGKIRRYRNDITISKTKEGKLLVINRLGLEDYVKGVLYHEVSHRWPMEALKAQAVASRSYVVHEMKVRAHRSFDVTSDTYSQVYGGRSAERYRTNLAVDYTKGEILEYNGEVLPTYFHANSGGYTENVGELWNHDLPPLRGVRSPYSIGEPHYRWKKNVQLKEIQDKLNAVGYELGLIKEIYVAERNESGRIRTLVIETRDGKKVSIPGKEFRIVVGANLIKSNNYRIEMQGYYADFIGYGWGHGVGMCQWGAQNMARQRFDYKNILLFYYPGAAITELGKGRV